MRGGCVVTKSGAGARKAGSVFFYINTKDSVLLKQVVQLLAHINEIKRQIHKDKHVTIIAQQF